MQLRLCRLPKSIFDGLGLHCGQYCHCCNHTATYLFLCAIFKKLKVTSAYEYLEARFGPSVRVIGSLLFVLFHLGRVAIVIYLPTLAITSVSDMNPIVVASLVGVLCILYTF